MQILIPAFGTGQLAQPSPAQAVGQRRINVGLEKLADFSGGQFWQTAGKFLITQIGVKRVGAQRSGIRRYAIAQGLIGSLKRLPPGRKRFGCADIAADANHQHRNQYHD